MSKELISSISINFHFLNAETKILQCPQSWVKFHPLLGEIIYLELHYLELHRNLPLSISCYTHTQVSHTVWITVWILELALCGILMVNLLSFYTSGYTEGAKHRSGIKQWIGLFKIRVTESSRIEQKIKEYITKHLQMEIIFFFYQISPARPEGLV